MDHLIYYSGLLVILGAAVVEFDYYVEPPTSLHFYKRPHIIETHTEEELSDECRGGR